MNIYVGNLSYELTEEDLKQAFGEFGTVSSVKIIMDRYTGRSKGFGFVEMANDEEGKNAISKLNGKELKGRPIKCDVARPPATGGRVGGGRF
jgi:RNA recognition motif-containing protein